MLAGCFQKNKKILAFRVDLCYIYIDLDRGKGRYAKNAVFEAI
jgi:hypothetical protein